VVEEVEVESVIEEEVVRDSDENPVTARIEDISSLGDVLLRFNTPMQNETVNTTHINSTVLSLYVKPATEWNLNDPTFN